MRRRRDPGSCRIRPPAGSACQARRLAWKINCTRGPRYSAAPDFPHPRSGRRPARSRTPPRRARKSANPDPAAALDPVLPELRDAGLIPRRCPPSPRHRATWFRLGGFLMRTSSGANSVNWWRCSRRSAGRTASVLRGVSSGGTIPAPCMLPESDYPEEYQYARARNDRHSPRRPGQHH